MQRVNINGVTCSIIFIRPAFKYQLQRAFLFLSYSYLRMLIIKLNKEREKKKSVKLVKASRVTTQFSLKNLHDNQSFNVYA